MSHRKSSIIHGFDFLLSEGGTGSMKHRQEQERKLLKFCREVEAAYAIEDESDEDLKTSSFLLFD